jgi:hypothetical protein
MSSLSLHPLHDLLLQLSCVMLPYSTSLPSTGAAIDLTVVTTKQKFTCLAPAQYKHDLKLKRETFHPVPAYAALSIIDFNQRRVMFMLNHRALAYISFLANFHRVYTGEFPCRIIFAGFDPS